MKTKNYIPAAGQDWLLPFYDSFSHWLGVERIHTRLLRQAAIRPGHRVLEIGCGTGNMTLLVKRRDPEVEVIGIDPDPKALVQAQHKAGQVGVSLPLTLSYAQALPYPDGSFDRVLSAFMFHHIPAHAKLDVLREARRVLKGGGSLHLVDFVPADDSSAGVLSRFLHHSHDTRFATADTVPLMMKEAGFAVVTESNHFSLPVGRIASYFASTPAW